MNSIAAPDAAGRPRSPATLPGYHAGRAPRNKGRRYPADPPRVEEIVAVMRQAGERPAGMRFRGLAVVLWRAGLRISEALALSEGDLEPDPWLKLRMELPVGALFCVISGPTAGRPWSAAAARTQFRRLAVRAGVRRRFAPHQLRHAHAVEMPREGVPLNVIQRQLGHADLGITSVCLQGIDSGEIVDVVHGRRAPVIPAAVALGP
jgi:site-specific recombinase XerD